MEGWGIKCRDGGVSLRELARMFKALGDENRLRILACLKDATYGVCDLARCVGVSQPTLSHHLKILRDTGLVQAEKEGQWIFCSLNNETFEHLGLDFAALLERHGKGVISK